MERQKERAAEKERLRQQQLEEQDRREREAIAAANLSQEEKEHLMKEHEKNIKKLQVGDLPVKGWGGGVVYCQCELESQLLLPNEEELVNNFEDVCVFACMLM